MGAHQPHKVRHVVGKEGERKEEARGGSQTTAAKGTAVVSWNTKSQSVELVAPNLRAKIPEGGCAKAARGH